ncbi:MAG: TldD/PmbA family protein [Dorea sp.]|nr:TldD/PmbA family protein [Dorea sp.]
MMDTFIAKFSEAAKAAGIGKLEFYFETLKKSSADVYQNKVWSTSKSEVTACLIQGEYEGYNGNIYVEDYAEEFFKEEIAQLKESAIFLKKPFISVPLFDHEKKESFELIDQRELAELLRSAEEDALRAHPDLHKFDSFTATETIRAIRIQDELGHIMEDESKNAFFRIHAEARNGSGVMTAGAEVVTRGIDQLDFARAANEAATEAVDLLYAEPLQGGTYPVILKNKVFTEMFMMFGSTLAADTVRRKMSKFAGKLDEQIASPIVNITEEPELDEGVNNRAFDDEGVPTSKKEIVKDGVLKTYLYNLEEAKLAGCQSTGNAFKPDIKSRPRVSVSNMVFVGQEKEREDLMAEMGDGLYITNCDGMFAGADVISGDFSLISRGYIIKDGRKAGSVRQITIAGNYFDMLKKIKAIANDYLASGDKGGAYMAPSVYVGKLVVSGL